MTAQRWQQVKRLFDEAVERDPVSRAEFLRQSCGPDEELLEQVEALLASDGQKTSFSASPFVEAAGIAAAAPARALLRPTLTLVLKDRYELEREIGRGGMSVVYMARDRQLLAKRVVVKILLEETSTDPWISRKFLQEMEALARIDHPGVVGVLDTGLTPEGKPFLVMQYVEGDTLRGHIEKGPMDLVRTAKIVRQVAQALAAAHEKGVWHRDLKPENIMLQHSGDEDYVKLIDFGIAGIQDSKFTGEATKVAGTLTYMAPEQFAGNPCAASDTYALGVVAYEMLTGKPPFPASSMSHLVQDGLTWEMPRRTRPDVPDAAEKAILKAVSFRPEARQASIRDLGDDLFLALTGGQ